MKTCILHLKLIISLVTRLWISIMMDTKTSIFHQDKENFGFSKTFITMSIFLSAVPPNLPS